MSMTVTNAAERRLSFAQFIGLFIITLLLSSFAIFQSIKRNNDAPTEDFAPLRKKNALLAELALVGGQLQQLDGAAHNNPTDFNRLQAIFNGSSQRLYTQISGKDSAELRSIKDVLSMYESYALTLGGVKTNTDNANAGNVQAQALLAAQNENLQLRAQIAQNAQMQAVVAAAQKGGGGGGGGAAPAAALPLSTPSGGGGNNNDAAVHQMQKQIEQGRAKTVQTSADVKNSITLIRAELTRITCIVGGTKERRANIENSLKQIETLMQGLN